MSDILIIGAFSFLLLGGLVYLSYSRATEESLAEQRLQMVSRQIAMRGVKDKRVLDAMRTVERHRFVPERLLAYAYGDFPLPIGEDQTISQPYIVGLMTELLKPQADDMVLEIGTGSGYQAAVLAELTKEVYTIEIIEKLAKKAEALLQELGYKNIFVKAGDGYKGWPQKAPFDKIIVTAAPGRVPEPLIEQLKIGGRMVIPVGKQEQYLLLIKKEKDGIKKEYSIPVRFVPMTGEVEKTGQN
ncbi:MAG: protein-L-isoaspartate(D-aspartate) O-methyltransferase [Candidatus Omnitrophota bacterium]